MLRLSVRANGDGVSSSGIITSVDDDSTGGERDVGTNDSPVILASARK